MDPESRRATLVRFEEGRGGLEGLRNAEVRKDLPGGLRGVFCAGSEMTPSPCREGDYQGVSPR